MSNKYFGAIALTGGGTGAVDAIAVALLSEGDILKVVSDTYEYAYNYSASEAGSEDSPRIIIPDDNVSGTGAWVLRGATPFYLQGKGGDIASASPLVIDTDGDYFDVTGTTGFAAMTVVANRHFFLQFDGALVMTHHATNLDLPGEANITTVAGDVAEFFSTGSNTVQCVNYTRADGTAVVTDISKDTSPQLGGLLDTNAFAIDESYATVASHATTSAIWAALGNVINFTGTETITDFPAANRAGSQRFLICAAACVFTHAGNITVQGGATYTAVAGDVAVITALSTTTFKVNILRQANNYMATDTIWDAAGDTVYGTGVNAGAILAAGAAGALYGMNAGQTAPEYKSVLVDANGRMTNPSQPAFLVRPTSQQNNIAVGVDVTVVFGTEVFDQGNNFASNTFTAPVMGKYQLNCTICVEDADSAATYYAISIMTSNREYKTYWPSVALAADHTVGFSISQLVDMDAADTAYIVIGQIAGTQQTDILTPSAFSGFLVC